MKRLARQTTVVLAVAALALLGWKLRSSLLTLALAVVIAASVEPLIRGLSRRRMPRWLALGGVYLAAALAVGGAALLMGALLPDELRELADGLQRLLAALRTHWPSVLPALPLSLDALGENLGPLLLAGSTTLFHALFHLCLALVLSLCWSLGAETIERTWLSLLPNPGRGRTRKLWRAVLDAAGSRMRSETAQSLVSMVVLAALFSALRVPYAIVAALMVAILRAVPLFGIGAATLLVFACGAAGSVFQGAVAATGTLLLLMALSQLIGRHFVSVRAPRLITAWVVLALFETAGTLGLLLAPLVIAIVSVLAAEWFRRTESEDSARV